jgi:cysteine desulfurase
MGYPQEEARGALRFSLGRTTTAADVAEAAELVLRTIAHQRDAAAGLSEQRAAALGRSATAPTSGPSPASGVAADRAGIEASAG